MTKVRKRAIWLFLATCLGATICSAANDGQLPVVAVLSTGGTIASKQNPSKGGYEAALTGEDLVAAVPAIRKVAQIRVEQISNISSSDITPEIWMRLARRTNELLAIPIFRALWSRMARTRWKRQRTSWTCPRKAQSP
jgi:L-asparaginase